MAHRGLSRSLFKDWGIFFDKTVAERGGTMHRFPAHVLTEEEIRDDWLMLIPSDEVLLEEAIVAHQYLTSVPYITDSDRKKMLED